jgi:erythronate-4-phosphate dehydrogenase
MIILPEIYNSMIRIVADDKIPFLKGALESLAEIVYLPGNSISRDDLVNADALLIRTRTKCTETLLKGTKVKFIGTATIGFDHIDTKYCNKHKIKWTNAPGCNSSSVQQYITASLLKLSRDHRFKLKDKTIGIVGAGNVGSKVEKIARILGMKVLLNDPPRARQEKDKDFVVLNNILNESDIITVHVPLKFVGEDKTYHMFNARSFKKVKKGAWFINSSRGEVVDTESIKMSIDSGRLGGAVIDVWENEPDIDLVLMGKTFISTPHIAGYSTDGKANGTSMVVNSLSDYFNLSLKNWYPENVPGPFNTEIPIDGNGKTDEDIIREAVQFTYNIEEDDIRFRFSPADFEKQRGDYPLRREFNSFTVRLHGCSASSHKALADMGFRIFV